MVFVLMNHVTFSSELEIKRFFSMSMSTSKGLLSIGEVARRTGLAVSAIRYYDDEGWSRRAARPAAGACSSAPTSGACPSS
jgi:hypothetical protein